MLSTPYLMLLAADGIRRGQMDWTTKRPIRVPRSNEERHRKDQANRRHRNRLS